MAIVRESITKVLYAGTAASSIAVTKPTGLANGDVLVFIMYVTSNAITITWPTGFVEQFDSGTAFSNETIGIATKPITNAGGEPASYTPSWVTTTQYMGVLVRYSGVDTTTPQDAACVTALIGNSTSCPTPSITTVTDNAMIISMVWKAVAANTFSTSAVTEFFDHVQDGGTTNGGALGDVVQAVAGASGTKTWTASVKTNYDVATWALRPAATAAAAPSVPLTAYRRT